MSAPMDNKNNPNIIEAGRATQFGQPRGADPSEAGTKGATESNSGCIRSKLRRLSVFVPETENIGGEQSRQDIARAFGKKKLTELNLAEIAAIDRWRQGKSHYKAMDSLIDQVSGKLVEKRAEVRTDSLGELLKAAAELEKADDTPAGN